MKFCSMCGKELEDNAAFCAACGASTAPSAQAAQSQSPNYNQAPNYNQGYNPNYNQSYNPGYNQGYAPYAGNPQQLVQQLSQKINTNGIIWIVIGVLQILFGFIAIFPAIVGVLNIISGVNDMKYSKAILVNPVGIVSKHEPTTSAIITLVYNILVGGVVGVIGSIYYFVAIRGFVMNNKDAFLSLENTR